MTSSSSNTTANVLGITPGHTVRLIGTTSELETALQPLPDDVTLTSLASEPADIGLLVVEDDNDLRERLFTELDGLLGATHVWVVTHHSGPDFSAISSEADTVSWHATTRETLPGGLTAVRLQKA